MSEAWDIHGLQQSPIHGDLAAMIRAQRWQDWPCDQQLNALLVSDARTLSGRRLHFVAQPDAGYDGAAAYEKHIDASGEIPIRPRSWHDLFNALMWILYPATKTALNAVHITELAGGQRNRTARRDAVTLLDECGVLLAVSDERLTRLHAAHRWDAFFCEERTAWGEKIQPLIIGHGLYEQCLTPYVGLTAKALHLPIPATWFSLSQSKRRHQVDTMLAEKIVANEAVMSTRELLPLPVLGVPGWWPANRESKFYANQRYFRKKH